MTREEKVELAKAKLARATERVEKLGDDLRSAVEWEVHCMAELQALG
jgi:hypothetical protein